MSMPRKTKSQTTTDTPHTQIGVSATDLPIPRKVFFVFILYDSMPGRVYHKRMESFEEALTYVTTYKEKIAGTLVIKEYWDREMLLIVGNNAPNANRNKKAKKKGTKK